MNETLIFQLKDETARKVIYHQYLEIKALKLEVEKLKQQLKPTQVIGFHVKEGEKQIQTAFKSVRHHVPD